MLPELGIFINWFDYAFVDFLTIDLLVLITPISVVLVFLVYILIVLNFSWALGILIFE